MRSAVRVAVGCLLVVAVAACSGDVIPDKIPDKGKFTAVAAEFWRGPDHIRQFTGVSADLGRGADHCDWDGTHFVVVRQLLPGADTTNQSGFDWHMFVRDPDEIPDYSYEAEADLDRPLPDDAEKLGEDGDGSIELWYSESDPHFLYLKGEGFTEAWVSATDWYLCY